MEGVDFLSQHLDYTNNTESHKVYHRWSAITAVGALLGRSRYIPFGHGKLFPNFYTMLLGDPGTRKSSSIKLIKSMLQQVGYETFSADRSSREKFLLDLAGVDIDGAEISNAVKNGMDIMEKDLWGGELLNKDIKEVFVVADEFNEFINAGNVDFYTTLGNLWDWDNDDKPYTDRVKNSRSVSIYQPTINLLGGNTQENFSRAFPTELLGHGFLSRLLFIHGIPSGRKIPFPEPPPADKTRDIQNLLRNIIQNARNRTTALVITPDARSLLEEIYISHPELDDPRFKGYNTRRYTHLLKLCIIISACLFVEEINEHVVVYANTILSAAEHNMPISIGEFGKSKNSDVAHKILSFLKDAKAPVGAKQLWGIVHKDLDKMGSLSDLLHNLQAAEKVQFVTGANGRSGWLPKREVVKTLTNVDWNLLTEEERNLL